MKVQSGRNALLTTFLSDLRFPFPDHTKIVWWRNVGLCSGYIETGPIRLRLSVKSITLAKRPALHAVAKPARQFGHAMQI